MNITPGRAVAVLTPAVFAPVAGAISVFAADKAGVEVDQTQLTAIFIAGATIAFAKAGLWLKGWQDYEKRQEVVPADALEPASDLAGSVEADEAEPFDDGEPEAALDALDADLDLDLDEPDFDFDEAEFDEADFDDEADDGATVLASVAKA